MEGPGRGREKLTTSTMYVKRRLLVPLFVMLVPALAWTMKTILTGSDVGVLTGC
jgi:hypothetical protein